MLTEPGGRALERRIRGAHVASSVVSKIEVHRAVRRAMPEPAKTLALVEQVLERIDLVLLHSGVVEQAMRVAPPELRSLDAIHLASAFEFADQLDAFVTYDRQLARAASDAGLPVDSP